ncbi:MAG: mannosyltransferase family protein, partial [Acidimicrobiales bacterium]
MAILLPLARRSQRLSWAAGSAMPVVTYAVVALALLVVTKLSVDLLPFAPIPPHPFPDKPWFEGWARWDTGWYWAIARDGYYYAGPNQQSPVAFFPAYPLAMRAVGWVVGDLLVAGVLVSFAAGLGSVVLFHRWCRSAAGRPVARLALVLLVTYPFSFYLFGVVYSDALFLAAALGAFALVEHDRPLLAGLAGAVATA